MHISGAVHEAKKMLVLLAMLMASIIVVFSILASVSIGGLAASAEDGASRAKSYAVLLNDMRSAQVAFQIQVQEWKNILIRGNDKELYAKHLKGFEEKEGAMNDTLYTLRQEMVKVSLDISKIDVLLAEHAALGAKYREALTTWNPDDESPGKAVDKLLRGIESTASAALTDLAEQIEKEVLGNLTAANDKAIASSKTELSVFFSVAGVALIMALLVCYGVGRSVLGKVGAEPGELAKAVALLAQGDFTKSIEAKKGDSTSLAASIGLMQMRLASMLRAIANGAREMEEAAEKGGIVTSMGEAKESLREAKRSVKSLQEAAKRFKV